MNLKNIINATLRTVPLLTCGTLAGLGLFPLDEQHEWYQTLSFVLGGAGLLPSLALFLDNFVGEDPQDKFYRELYERAHAALEDKRGVCKFAKWCEHYNSITIELEDKLSKCEQGINRTERTEEKDRINYKYNCPFYNKYTAKQQAGFQMMAILG